MTAVLLLTGCDNEGAENTAEEFSAASVTQSSEVQSSVTEPVSETAEKITETAAAEPEIPKEKKSYEPYQIKLYNSLGTGIPRPDDYGEDLTEYYLSDDLEEILPLMKDKTAAQKIETEAKVLYALAEENYSLYVDPEEWSASEAMYSDCNAYNGYLFYEISYRGNYFMRYCAVFDLRTGERLELSDLFFEGEEFLPLLNKKINEEIQKLYCEDYEYEEFEYVPVKREFAGLTEDGFYFDSSSFYFPANNPYFAKAASVNIPVSGFDNVLNVPYDMKELFEDGADETLYFRKDKNIISSARYAHSRDVHTGNINIHLFEESTYLTAEQAEFLNSKALGMLEMLDELNPRYDWTAYTNNDEPLYNAYIYDGTRYEYRDIFEININIINNDIAQILFRQSDVYDDPNPGYNLHYGLETLEPLDTEQLFERVFGDKEYVWKYVSVYRSGNGDRITDMEGFIDGEAPDLSKLNAENIYLWGEEIHFAAKVDDCWIWGYIKAAE